MFVIEFKPSIIQICVQSSTGNYTAMSSKLNWKLFGPSNKDFVKWSPQCLCFVCFFKTWKLLLPSLFGENNSSKILLRRKWTCQAFNLKTAKKYIFISGAFVFNNYRVFSFWPKKWFYLKDRTKNFKFWKPNFFVCKSVAPPCNIIFIQKSFKKL